MTEPFPPLPSSWQAALGPELDKPYFQKLRAFVARERAEHQVFPPAEETFAALEHTPLEDVRVVVLGQDPYHDDDQAHGLCFSVRRGIKVPPSLRNIYKELKTDLDIDAPDHGFLEAWADRGVLLLNTVLTVRAHQANSHRKQGWETFTDEVIAACAAREAPMVFVLWGKPAQKKAALIERVGEGRHAIIAMAHPSPLSAKKFLGTRPFSQVNAALEGFGVEAIDWRLPD
ncbi:uracil-DNA glycosylase [Pseudenhygromyxa sp. WMMC2535]|uniref:uracil-DNA glycosylase n=1 Tax=Pseudenhygromyxa sp. WMMC2535 TaxID=2712867 RepID=UPI001556F4B9|nr:uracil-DNA glycosylase [Pseudenhygromyxa sp. WMMC2535]NVB41627.1 uracil-DNA glycosylase [Pseudenhygromyxa sp. WMMC2535]NVB43481.1 uracil-DNA glycosylase [Pseudenhygromyxa sp. WMMC2535]